MFYFISIGGCLNNFSLNSTTSLINFGPSLINGPSEITNLFSMDRMTGDSDNNILRVSDGNTRPINWLQDILHFIATHFKQKDEQIKLLVQSFLDLSNKHQTVVVPEISVNNLEKNLEDEIVEFQEILRTCRVWAASHINRQFISQQTLIKDISNWVMEWIDLVKPKMWNSELIFWLSSIRNPEKYGESFIGNPFFKLDGSLRTQAEFLAIFTKEHVGQFYMVGVVLV